MWRKAKNTIRLILALSTSLLFGPFTPEATGQDSDPALLGNWTFDDDSGADFTGDFPLRFVGPFEIVPGLFDNGVRFLDSSAGLDNGRAVRPSDDESLNLTDGDFTMQAWVFWGVRRFGEFVPEQQVIVEKFTAPVDELDPGGPGWTLSRTRDNAIRFFSKADVIDVTLQSDVEEVVEEEWSHIVVRKSGLVYELYVNGFAVTSGEAVGDRPPSDSPLLVGLREEDITTVRARFDDVAFWDRALEFDDIETLYNGGIGTEVGGNFEQGLIAYYPLNSDGTDASGVTGPVDILGQAHFNDEGRFGNALSLTPAPIDLIQGYARTEDDGGLGSPFNFGEEDFTVSVWVNYDTDQGEQVMVEKFNNEAGPGWSFTKLRQGPNIYHFFYLQGGSLNSPPQTEALIAEWNHMLLTVGAGFGRMYRNGELLTEGEVAVIPDASEQLHIGRRNDGDARGFFMRGIIDDVAVWTRVFEEDEVLNLYNEGAGQTACCLSTPEPRCGLPQNVAIDNVGENELRVTWEAPEPVDGVAIAGYNVFRTAPGPEEQVNQELVTTTELVLTGLDKGTRHCFRVRCLGDNDLASRESDQTCANTDGTRELREGLIGYWPFDENDGTDCSGGQRDLDVSPKALFESGVLGDSLVVPTGEVFDVAPAFRPGDDPELNLDSGDFTVQVWVNFVDTVGEQVLVEKLVGGGGPGWSLTKLDGDEFLFFTGGSVRTGPLIIDPDEWHLIVFRKSGDKADFFFDGQPAGEGTLSSLRPAEAPLIVGQRNQEDGRGFILNGSIDEIALWNRALSDANIDELFNDGFGTMIRECGVVEPQPPNAPTDVQAAAGPNDVTISWTAAASAEGVTIVGYDVYQTNPSQAQVNTDPVDGTEFNVADLASGQEYCFIVRTVGDNDLESADSNEACATTTVIVVGVGPFLRGDCDGNGTFGGSPTEAIVLLNFSFRGGPPPGCLAACDAEANGSLGITDALRILRAAFLGVGQPDAPFPKCTTSADPADADLGCETPFCAN